MISRVLTLSLALHGSATMAADAPHFTFEVASPAILGNPHDLVLSPDGRQLLVSDVNKDRIVVLDADTLALVDTFANGEVDEPHDVTFGPNGRVYVADTGNSRIAIFEYQDSRARLVGEMSDRIRRPEGVAVSADGTVYASGAASGNVVKFARDGAVLAEAGGFRSPHDLAITATGHVWLADAGNDRMVRLDATLKVVEVLEDEPYAFNGPRYLDISGSGRLVIADKYAHQIKLIAADGTLVEVLGSTKPGLGTNLFRTPEGVALDAQRAWFSDSGNNRVVRYRFLDPR